MTIASRMTILDPVSDIVEDAATFSPRLDSLNGKVVGLYGNNKMKVTELLDMVGGILSERYDLKRIVRGSYNGGRVMRPDEWVDVHECDAIVLTHGD